MFEAVSALLQRGTGFAVCGTLSLSEAEPLLSPAPDVIVAEATSAADLALLQQRYPAARIVALVLKPIGDADQVSSSWRTSTADSLPAFLGVLREAAGLYVATDSSEAERLHSFNRRDRDVLLRLAHGESVKEVAQQLGMSFKAVDSLKYRIMRKLQVTDRVQLTRLAIRYGLLTP